VFSERAAQKADANPRADVVSDVDPRTSTVQQTNMYKIGENGQHTVQSSSSLPKTTTMTTNHASGVEQKCVDSLARLSLSLAQKT
jgi:hypothetical protein